MERAVLRKSRLNVSYPGWSFRMWMSASNKNPHAQSPACVPCARSRFSETALFFARSLFAQTGLHCAEAHYECDARPSRRLAHTTRLLFIFRLESTRTGRSLYVALTSFFCHEEPPASLA